MAIGSTSTIKDANGVSVTVKDVAADYLVEQSNGTFNRENFRTEASQVVNNCRSISFRPNADRVSSSTLIRLDEALPSASLFCDADASIAAIQSDGTVKILKAGRYIVFARCFYYYGVDAFLHAERKRGSEAWGVLHRCIFSKVTNSTATFGTANYLKAGDFVRLATESVVPNTCKKDETKIELIYLGE